MNYSFLNKRHLLMENPLALIIMRKNLWTMLEFKQGYRCNVAYLFSKEKRSTYKDDNRENDSSIRPNKRTDVDCSFVWISKIR